MASIIVEPDGTNTIVQSPRANRHVTRAQVDEHAGHLFGGTRIAMLQLETSMGAALAFEEAASSHGAGVMLNPAPASADAKGLLRGANYIIANEIEAEALGADAITSPDDAQRAARRLGDGGAAVAITLGGDGVALFDGETSLHIAALHVDVVDTVGAGDAFCAAFALRKAEGASLADAARFANAAGALACTKHGAEPSMPYRHEVDALLAARGGSR